MFNWLWSKIKAPFETVPETFEVRDSENNAIVAYKRPEEMAIKRWTAQAGQQVKEDFEDAGDMIEAGTPIIGIALMYMGGMWMLWLLLRVFSLAVKGTAILTILAEVWHLTWVMACVTVVMLACYITFTTIATFALRYGWRLFAKLTGRKKKGFMWAAGDAFRRRAYAN